MALCYHRVVSKQIWEWIGALNELASHRPVSLTWWVPAHSGIPGSEQAGHLVNNNIYFAKGQVHQKGKSPSKLAAILRATKEKKTEKKNYATNI